MIKLGVNSGSRNLPMLKIIFTPCTQAINLLFILRQSGPNIRPMILYFAFGDVGLVHNWHICRLSVNKDFNAKLIYEHFNPVTLNSAVTSIQCVISLRAEKPNFCIRQMVGQAWQEESIVIHVKFVKGGPNSDNCVGASNIVHGE
jgi:hypothetical protein